MAKWLDTPWQLKLSTVKADGYQGIVRYICSDYNTGPGSALPQKRITKAELDATLAAGIDVMVNFEDAANDYLGGYDRGLAKGKLAGGWMFNTLKWPSGGSCCSSIDADIGSVWGSPEKDYQKGFADGLTSEGPYVPGVYGSAVALNGAWADNTAHVFWLTAATSWSHGQKPAVQHLWQNGYWPHGSNADIDYTDTQPMGSYLQASGGDHMPLTDADKAWIKAELAAAFTDADIDRIWGKSNTIIGQSPAGALKTTLDRVDADNLQAQVAKGAPTAAENAVAVVAALPANPGGGATPDEVKQAVVEVINATRTVSP